MYTLRSFKAWVVVGLRINYIYQFDKLLNRLKFRVKMAAVATKTSKVPTGVRLLVLLILSCK